MDIQEKHPHPNPMIRMLVMGISDGAIGMMVLVASLTALHGTPNLIIITGAAYILSGIVSMAITTYLFLMSERHTLQNDVLRETLEIETEPEEEKQELRDIFKAEGYSPEAAEKLLETVTRDKDTWLRAQLKFELNKTIEQTTVTIKQDIIGVAVGFGISSAILLPFILGISDALIAAMITGTGILFVTTATNLSLHINDWKHGVKATLLVVILVIAIYLTVRMTGIGFA